MAQASSIEWTEVTWNPVTGCSKVSPGCANCYAEGIARRFAGRGGNPTWKPWTPANAAHNVVLHEARVTAPLRWRKPRVVFVNSMSDLFHEQVPFEYIARVFDVMCSQTEDGPTHTFQVLTKRPERMVEFFHWLGRDDASLGGLPWDSALGVTLEVTGALPNIWLGVSIENNRWVSRADALRSLPYPPGAAFISAEPLLGPLTDLDLTGIDWLIAGGESGQGARPMQPEWVLDLRDRCAVADTSFFFKQWGSWAWADHAPDDLIAQLDATDQLFAGERYAEPWKVGKKAAGRLLDGRTHDDMPELAS